MSNKNTSESFKDKTVLVSMISGLFAGAFAKLVTHPIDTIKAKIQVETKKLSIRNVLSSTIKNDGIAGLYRGLPVSVLGSMPGCVLYFGAYEFAKKNLLLFKNFAQSEFLMYFIGGMFAETVSCLVFVPVDIIKERRQVQTSLNTYNYKNDFDALKTILKYEKIRGLYKAYGATLLSFGPMSAFYFMFYEYFKGYFVNNEATTYIQKVKGENIDKLREMKTEISFFQSMICSALAGSLASIITNPLDLVKLRMQVQRASESYRADKAVYRNMFQGLFFISQTEGVNGLFKGSIVRALYSTPTVAITMSILEVLKPIVEKVLN